jgi:hypothetical protein
MRLAYCAGLGVAGVAAFTGCQVFFSMDGLTGSAVDSGVGAGDALGGVSGDVSVDVPADAAAGGGEAAPPGSCDCLPSVPTGWDVVAFAVSGATACPQGYSGSSDVVVDPALGPATCKCTCAIGAQPSCEQGTVIDTHSSNSTCTNAPIHDLDAGGGACTAFSFGNLSAYHSITAPPPTGGTCAGQVQTSVPSTGTMGRICAMGDAGTCAAAGSECRPSVAAPFARCIAQSGALPCPAGFSVAHAAGASIVDTRACGTCSCSAPSTTCNGSFSFYSDRGCASVVTTLAADGVCHPTPGGATAVAYTFTSTAQASCAAPAAQPAPQGNATLAQPTTVCCR